VRLSSALLGFLCGCQQLAHSVSAQPSPEPQPVSPAPPVDPLGPLSLGSRVRPGEAYSFALGPCTGSAPTLRCELAAQVVRAGKVVFSLPLASCWSDQARRVAPATVPGIEGSFDERARWLAFAIGQGEVAQLLASRVVRLAPQREGVLLRTVYGGAPRDVLLVRRNDQLRALEIAGRWTDLSVEARAEAADEILLSAQVSGEAGYLWARALSWESSNETLTFSDNADPPAFLINAPPNRSPASALPSGQPFRRSWS